jgi:hypothetical protein
VNNLQEIWISNKKSENTKEIKIIEKNFQMKIKMNFPVGKIKKMNKPKSLSIIIPDINFKISSQDLQSLLSLLSEILILSPTNTNNKSNKLEEILLKSTLNPEEWKDLNIIENKCNEIKKQIKLTEYYFEFLKKIYKKNEEKNGKLENEIKNIYEKISYLKEMYNSFKNGLIKKFNNNSKESENFVIEIEKCKWEMMNQNYELISELNISNINLNIFKFKDNSIEYLVTANYFEFFNKISNGFFTNDKILSPLYRFIDENNNNNKKIFSILLKKKPPVNGINRFDLIEFHIEPVDVKLTRSIYNELWRYFFPKKVSVEKIKIDDKSKIDDKLKNDEKIKIDEKIKNDEKIKIDEKIKNDEKLKNDETSINNTEKEEFILDDEEDDFFNNNNSGNLEDDEIEENYKKEKEKNEEENDIEAMKTRAKNNIVINQIKIFEITVNLSYKTVSEKKYKIIQKLRNFDNNKITIKDLIYNDKIGTWKIFFSMIKRDIVKECLMNMPLTGYNMIKNKIISSNNQQQVKIEGLNKKLMELEKKLKITDKNVLTKILLFGNKKFILNSNSTGPNLLNIFNTNLVKPKSVNSFDEIDKNASKELFDDICNNYKNEIDDENNE